MSENKKDEFTILRGGKTLSVQYEPTAQDIAAGQPGRTEDILIRMIPLREMPQLGSAWADDIKLIALVANRDEAWVDTLNFASQMLVLEEGRNLNFLRFKSWFAAQTRTLEALGQTPMVQRAIEEALKSLNQKNSPPAGSASPKPSNS